MYFAASILNLFEGKRIGFAKTQIPLNAKL